MPACLVHQQGGLHAGQPGRGGAVVVRSEVGHGPGLARGPEQRTAAAGCNPQGNLTKKLFPQRSALAIAEPHWVNDKCQTNILLA